MTGRETATPGSSNMDGGVVNHKTPKDRKCKYCHEMFTSSSLGRHLDQFIKEDKPKPPDGKHDVEEIRNTRGGVTRRQARISSAKRDITAASGHTMTPDGDASPPSKKLRLNGPRTAIWNGASLESTGVLRDFASAPSSSLFQAEIKGEDVVRRQREAMQERDDGRAAKMALIEILDNIKAARSRTAPSAPFSFDFLAQSFPALVLLMLKRQPTILSSQLIPNARCWPIGPPDKSHLELLRKHLSTRLDDFALELRATRHARNSEDSVLSHSSHETTNSNLDFSAYHEHLSNAFKAWSALTDDEKGRQYHIEFARAFAREQEAHAETKNKLADAEKRNTHNELQISRLNELQQPTEFLKSPLKAAPYSGEVAKLVASKLGEGQIPTAEALIDKWRPSVQSHRGWQRGYIAQLHDVGLTEAEADGNGGSNSHGPGAGANGVDVHATNGMEQGHSTTTPPMDPDGGDSVDASGEDDDDMAAVMPPAHARNSTIHAIESMIDPSLSQTDITMRDTGDFGAAHLLDDINGKIKNQQ